MDVSGTGHYRTLYRFIFSEAGVISNCTSDPIPRTFRPFSSLFAVVMSGRTPARNVGEVVRVFSRTEGGGQESR